MVSRQEQFITEFRAIYNTATQAEYGSALISKVERQGLKKLITRARRELAQANELSGSLKEDKEKVRKKVVQYLVSEGWPIEVLANAPDLAQTAVYHACVVAEFLIGDRGVDAVPNTIWSYATKNQFDRFVQAELVRAGKLGENSLLSDEWFGTQKRQEGYENSKVGYPTNVDSSQLYGVGKAHRYWPAQLMRNLEAIRLGKMNKEQLEKWGITEEEISNFTIPWAVFKNLIKNTDSIDELAIDILTQVMSLLKLKKVPNDQIINIVINSYSPRGMMMEHGNIPEVKDLWQKIFDVLRIDTQLYVFYDPLLVLVKERFSQAGHTFDIS